jgi:hypothetical protein
MSRKFIWAPVVALALLPVVAHAQFQQGDWTLTLTGSGQSDRDFDTTGLSALGQVGYFMTDQIEVNVRQGITFFRNGGTNFAGSTAIGGDFHFDLDRWQPYLGAQLGYIYGDGVRDSWIVGPEGGVKYFVNNTTYVFGQVGYNFNLQGSSRDDLWTYSLGIGFRW